MSAFFPQNSTRMRQGVHHATHDPCSTLISMSYLTADSTLHCNFTHGVLAAHCNAHTAAHCKQYILIPVYWLGVWQDAKKKAKQVHNADSHSGGEADGRGGEKGGGDGGGSRGQQEKLQEENLAPWQSVGLLALEALLVLRRADMHTGYEVRDAQQALIDLTSNLDTYEQVRRCVFVCARLCVCVCMCVCVCVRASV